MDFSKLLFWHWWIAGFALLILETFAPGAIFLWMGVSAFAVGALAWAIDMAWTTQIVIFGLLSALSFFVYRRLRPKTTGNDEPQLNRRGHSYVGRTFTLAEPIVNGVGKLRVDDSQWRIAGADLPAGARVRVVQADGATLHVQRVD